MAISPVILSGIMKGVGTAVGGGTKMLVGGIQRAQARNEAMRIDSINRAIKRMFNRREEQIRKGAIDRQFRQGERAEAKGIGQEAKMAEEVGIQKAQGNLSNALNMVNNSQVLRQNIADRLAQRSALERRI